MIRRTFCGALLALMAALGTTVGAIWMAGPAAGARPAAGPDPAADAAPAATPAQMLDGFAISWLPPGLGAASDFAYGWDQVSFTTRAWESRSASDAYHEDLAVDMLRGEGLRSAVGLYAFLEEYEDRPTWRFVPFAFRGHRGYLGADEAFWLVRPGVAVMLRIDRDRYGIGQMLRVAAGIHAVQD